MPSKRLLIVTGESSGEIYGALLARRLINDFELLGIGGKYMKEAGVEIIGSVTHAFGVLEVLNHLREIRENLRIAEEALRKVDGIILIDFPDFNLKLANKAKKIGKKVLYYVSPQIWAWRAGRINKIKKYVDQMAVILPFEEKMYRDFDVPVRYVGHPISELIREELDELGLKNIESITAEDRKKIRQTLGIEGETVITLMPGSRPSEIQRKLPIMLKLTEMFNKDKFHFVIPKAPNLSFNEEAIRSITEKRNITILNEKSSTALAMCDVAVITSGTSTLQATLLGVPMIVVYKVNPITYLLGRFLIKGVKHISLPNVIADFMNFDNSRVPELIQKISPFQLKEEIEKMLFDITYRERIKNFLMNISKYFVGKKPSEEVYKLCKQLFA